MLGDTTARITAHILHIFPEASWILILLSGGAPCWWPDDEALQLTS